MLSTCEAAHKPYARAFGGGKAICAQGFPPMDTPANDETRASVRPIARRRDGVHRRRIGRPAVPERVPLEFG